jgi:anti-sigma regulatory factor (Ser/Thr protein kinase)
MARIGKLAEIEQFVDGCAEQSGLDATRMSGLQVAVEEAFVNICNYAYPNTTGRVSITAEAAGEDLVLEISDHGIPFNVLLLPDPDTSQDIHEREVGGLGCYLIRKLTDKASYRRKNGANILTLVMHRSS